MWRTYTVQISTALKTWSPNFDTDKLNLQFSILLIGMMSNSYLQEVDSINPSLLFFNCEKSRQSKSDLSRIDVKFPILHFLFAVGILSVMSLRLLALPCCTAKIALLQYRMI